MFELELKFQGHLLNFEVRGHLGNFDHERVVS